MIFSSFLHRAHIPLPTPLGIFFFITGVLCSRATLLGFLRPFGGAFFGAIFSGKYTYAYIVAAILGQMLSGAPLYEMGKYIFAMTFYALITEKLPYKAKSRSSIRGGLFALSLALSGLCFMFTAAHSFTYTTLYDLMLLFLECSVSFSATVLFHKAIPIIKSLRLSYSFSSVEEISLVSFLGCALWGAKDITNFGIINLSDIVCIFIILTFAIRLGTSRGVIAGLTMGLVSALGSGRVDISSVSYAFSALAASFAGRYGAICGCSAFILANASVTALANGSTEVLINIFDIFTACIIYSIIPEKLLLRLTSFGSRDEKDRLIEDGRSYCEHVLKNAKGALDAIEGRMLRLREKRYCKGEAENRFFERTARKSCSGCGLRRVCWGRDVQKTVNTLKYALNDSIETGKFKSELMPASCLRPKEFREAFLQSAEVYRIEKMWQGKLREMQDVSQNQMWAFSKILSSAVTALSEVCFFDRALADDIARRTAEQNIECTDITVMRDSEGDPSVMLHLENCGGFSLCEKGVCEIISSACGKEMIRAGRRDCTSCNIKYVVKSPHPVTFAASGKSRSRRGASGDCVRWRVINKALYAAVLCDGMGSGEKASIESRSAADTLLDLLEAGVDGEAAAGIVNTLFIPYGEATFSAADLYLYNAREGTAKIIKCGGAATFTKSGERVDALYSKSMPIGSVLKNKVETFTLTAKSGDITVMVSDGVLESSKANVLKDTWLIDELEGFSGSNMHRLADAIVNRAMEKCEGEPIDDITVLTAIIE
ncbi:MAG: SpoIIE family protein phosphatase [Clostridia bacterium]|nr:SpoIIE family protein phosphatase [Clostridia bacterium]